MHKLMSILLCCTALSFGCVTKTKYVALETQHEQLQAKHTDLKKVAEILCGVSMHQFPIVYIGDRTVGNVVTGKTLHFSEKEYEKVCSDIAGQYLLVSKKMKDRWEQHVKEKFGSDQSEKKAE